MIDYELIEAEASELARRFWNEIETELTPQSTSQNDATPAS